jgi:hypothetical protein
MTRQQQDGLTFLTFDSLPPESVAHAVFTRRGGVSPQPWASLNVGATVGDDPDHVDENRRRLLAALNRSPDSTFDVHQIHSATIVEANGPRQGEPYPQADGVVTNSTSVTLMLRFADCVPILLYDPDQGAVGLVHAGWLGTVRQASAAAVARLHTAYGTDPARLRAAIGPAIGSHHYPVGPEVVESFRESFGGAAERYLDSVDGAVRLDLAGANEELLRAAGVAQIERSELCTACHLDDWYSHRGEGGKTGRFGAAIGLR